MMNTVILLVILVAAASIVLVATVVQNVMAQCSSLLDADIDIAEAVEAENTTMAGSTNDTTTNGNTTDVQFLSIQTAGSGSLSQVNDTAYMLELSNVSDSTILFSDRPERIVTSINTSDFVGNWTTGPNSFASDAPNDALIVENAQTGNLESAIIELFDPVYGTNTNTLTYTIMTDSVASINLPNEFGRSILVIDDASATHPIHIHLLSLVP